MSILKAYAQMAQILSRTADAATALPLDEIAIGCDHYAYIGARKSLKEQTLQRAELLPNKHGMTPEDWIRQWYGTSKWESDSGVFPDFVLAHQGNGTFGDGALLELKDAKGAAIASFNSTLPIARKALSSLSALVKGAVKHWDGAVAKQAEHPDERDCFYLIRTLCQNSARVRISLVQGTFFETLSTQDLLKAVWQELLRDKATEAELEQVADVLSRIDRTEISSTRRILGASIKPRLRLMSEIESEGNPHTYEEILPRTFNLIIKPNVETFADFKPLLDDWARRETLMLNWRNDEECVLVFDGFTLPLKVFPVKHKRNGIHWVCQMNMPPAS